MCKHLNRKYNQIKKSLHKDIDNQIENLKKELRDISPEKEISYIREYIKKLIRKKLK